MRSKGTRRFLWLWLLVPLVGVGLAAQDKPDFSGRWVLDDPPRPGLDIPRTLTISQRIVRTNVLGEPMPPTFLELTVAKQFENGVRSETYHIGTQGGTVEGGIGRPGTESRVSVQWHGDRLHIETGRYPGRTRDSGPYAEHSEEWSLNEHGRLSIIVVNRQSDSEMATQTLTYRRE